jgi:hypothetical protein
MATRPTARGRLVDGEIGGHRIVWFPDAALLAAEGHPGGEGTLALADDLPGAYTALRGALEASMEAELPGDRRFSWSEHGAVGVRRLDTAVNLSRAGDLVGDLVGDVNRVLTLARTPTSSPDLPDP